GDAGGARPEPGRRSLARVLALRVARGVARGAPRLARATRLHDRQGDRRALSDVARAHPAPGARPRSRARRPRPVRDARGAVPRRRRRAPAPRLRAQPPGGRMTGLIDFHSHFFSSAFFRVLAERSPLPGDPASRLAAVAKKTGIELPPEDT